MMARRVGILPLLAGPAEPLRHLHRPSGRPGGERAACQGLDCLDQMLLIDIQPDLTVFTPIAAGQPGDD